MPREHVGGGAPTGSPGGGCAIHPHEVGSAAGGLGRWGPTGCPASPEHHPVCQRTHGSSWFLKEGNMRAIHTQLLSCL